MQRPHLMKSIPLLKGLMLGFLAIATLISGPVWSKDTYKVVWVADGDTIKLNNKRFVRYIGINAPEIGHKSVREQPMAQEALRFNKQMVLNRWVRLEFDQQRRDRYNRLLAYVYLNNGEMVNAKIVAKGYAWCLPKWPNIRYEKLLLTCQRDAMAKKIGIWTHLKSIPEQLVGNCKSKRFHLTSCKFAKKMNRKNRIPITNIWQAFHHGLAPCHQCLFDILSVP